jgi:hypothetical protein
MKKFITALLVLFVINVGCKKENVGGGGLCGCSPMVQPPLNLVIKDSTGTDLLSDKTPGAYSKDQIKLFKKDASGNEVPVAFNIRPPFSYGDEKFNYNILSSAAGEFLRQSAGNIVYLKLGGGKTYELSLQTNDGRYDLEKLLIDKKQAEKDTGKVASYASIFYLTK